MTTALTLELQPGLLRVTCRPSDRSSFNKSTRGLIKPQQWANFKTLRSASSSNPSGSVVQKLLSVKSTTISCLKLLKFGSSFNSLQFLAPTRSKAVACSIPTRLLSFEQKLTFKCCKCLSFLKSGSLEMLIPKPISLFNATSPHTPDRSLIFLHPFRFNSSKFVKELRPGKHPEILEQHKRTSVLNLDNLLRSGTPRALVSSEKLTCSNLVKLLKSGNFRIFR